MSGEELRLPLSFLNGDQWQGLVQSDPEDPETTAAAQSLFLQALHHCATTLSNGFVPDSFLLSWSEEAVGSLVFHGLFVRSEGGFHVLNWEQFAPEVAPEPPTVTPLPTAVHSVGNIYISPTGCARSRARGLREEASLPEAGAEFAPSSAEKGPRIAEEGETGTVVQPDASEPSDALLAGPGLSSTGVVRSGISSAHAQAFAEELGSYFFDEQLGMPPALVGRALTVAVERARGAAQQYGVSFRVAARQLVVCAVRHQREAGGPLAFSLRNCDVPPPPRERGRYADIDPSLIAHGGR